jgi:hypothetical protein
MLMTLNINNNNVLTTDSIPNDVTGITCGHDFNQEIQPNTLPNSLKSITCGHDFNQVLRPNTLPHSLERDLIK